MAVLLRIPVLHKRWDDEAEFHFAGEIHFGSGGQAGWSSSLPIVRVRNRLRQARAERALGQHYFLATAREVQEKTGTIDSAQVGWINNKLVSFLPSSAVLPCRRLRDNSGWILQCIGARVDSSK